MKCYLRKNTWESALDLNTLQSTIFHNLKKISKVNKVDVLVPHTLSEMNKEDCISMATSLLSKHRNYLLLKNTFTIDEKLVCYDNFYHDNGSQWNTILMNTILMIKNCVYFIPCSCDKIYKGETGCPLNSGSSMKWDWKVGYGGAYMEGKGKTSTLMG